MKIIAILESEIKVGGGFNQALNAIMQMKKICEMRFDFDVITFHSGNESYLRELGLNAHFYKYNVFDKFLSNFCNNAWWQIIQSKIHFIGPLERRLSKLNCDLVYFVTPGSAPAALQKINYITTVWDICHRDNPEFPEVRNFNQYFARERSYIKSVGAAYLVLTESKQNSENITRIYGVDPKRLLYMPTEPSPFINQEFVLDKKEVLEKYDLEEGYFYYPAQFWAHKNHIRILEALILLRKKGYEPKVIFSGSDRGTSNYLKKFVLLNELKQQVLFLDFVPAEDVRGLYEGAIAAVMPTYFGPTNLPPLESWFLKVPIIYSSHLIEQAGDAALLIDPDNANELAEAMLKCTDDKVRMQLVESGIKRLRFFAEQRSVSEKKFLERLNQFAARRRCWD